jgi:hypothetical protein
MTKAKAAKAKKTNGKNKTQIVVALMRRAKGANRTEILAATGWKAVNPAAVAAPVKVRIDRSEFPYRYRIAGG